MSISVPRRRLAVALCAAVLGFAASHVSAENPKHKQQLLDTRKCTSCDLTASVLGGATLQGADLTGSDLSGADLYRTNLRYAILDDANFKDANLRGADLRHAKGANLSGAATDARTICPDGQNGPCK
jgi:uncharacterized protein YjbI with pentapeptide repeats